MAALTDLSDVINRLSGGNSGTPEVVWVHKVARTAGVVDQVTVAGRYATMWKHDGWTPGGATPTTVVAPSLSTTGAIPFTAPGGGRDKHLVQAGLVISLAGTVVLYDRLLHIGGLSGTSTSPQAVGGTLTRNTGGVGNRVFVEIWTLIGTTGTTLTMNYTNQAGVDSRTSTVNIGATGYREVNRLIPIPLQAGDTGVQSVEDVTLTASTGIVGNFGIMIGKPLAYFYATVGGSAGFRDYTTGLPGIPVVDPAACLAFYCNMNAAVIPEFTGALSFVEK